ncbi:hypothetical protein [Dyadobacter crusticola]|uniref:hypothetical protein n=1 Tax=Dyadobacter crusticola TaxID=292407 RepID=UPI0004E0DB9F|nr:hypothetical protein [Dyadobacter crusticola]
MSLVQKLPIGLGLACMIMLSSCSKEDVQVPTQSATEEIKNSNLRTSGNGLTVGQTVVNASPVFPSTNNSVGLNTFPFFWSNCPGNPNPAAYPSGTSTLWHLWGDQSMPWQLALPEFPSDPTAHCVVTVTSAALPGATVHKGSRAQTTIKNLIVGKKYTIKFWVATTKREVGTTYAKTAVVYLGRLGFGPTTIYPISLTNKKATWVEQSITFTAASNELPFSIAAYNEKEGLLSYVHVFVGKNAISQVN